MVYKTSLVLGLEYLGVQVTPAETTANAIKHLNSDKHFDLIKTNLNREEDGGEKAGLDLLEKIKIVQTPKIIFTRPHRIAQCKQAAREELGAYDVVSGFLGNCTYNG